MMIRRLILLGAALACVAAAQAQPTEIKRRVLALYKSSEGDSAAHNQTASLLEQPLESLGLAVDYADADNALPADMSPYRGVVTFFRGPVMTNAKDYLAWMNRQTAAGRKFVVFGEIGAMRDRASGNFLSHQDLNRSLTALGLRYEGFGTADPDRISLVSAAPLLSFEEPFTAASVGSYHQVLALSADATAYLTLNRTDLADGKSTPVLATKTGGYAARDYLLYEYRQADLTKQRWHLDPYAFLTETLGLESDPHFEAATLNGRRLWMAHIDGDGFLSPSESGILCGQVILERILSVYRMPISVSVVSSDLDRDSRALGIARAMFALPHVEAASHSASHPLDWSAPTVDLAAEIDGSITTMNERVMPEGKKVALFTWSSLANPPAEALRRLSALGVANINGLNGDTGFTNRFDQLYPSRTHLSPMTRRIDGMMQFYHRASNDFDLTSGWSKDHLDGYQNIIETFERTAAQPETPAHAYFHFYSGESVKSLRALCSVFDWATRHEVSPVLVSDYTKLVSDFQTAALARDDDGRTVVSNAGDCRTVVFSKPGESVDFSRSENVVGFADRNGKLYVFLDGSHRHVIALSSQPQAQASVVSAAGWVDARETEGDTLLLETRSFGRTELDVRVPKKGAYELRVTAADDTNGQRPYVAIAGVANGVAHFHFDGSGHDTVRISPTTATAGAARRAGLPLLAFSLFAFPLWTLSRARRRLKP